MGTTTGVNIESQVRKLDRFQQQHRGAAFIFAVIKKYGDDRGGALAALITYYGFLSLFPLLLVFYTVMSYTLSTATQKHLQTSVLSQFPVIGPQLLKNTDHPLHGNPLALIVGVLALLWGALGVSQILQHTFQEVWNVPGRKRPGFVTRLMRSVTLFAVLGIGIVATTVVSSLGTALNWGPLGSVLAALPSLAVNLGLFFLMFRILSPPDVAGRDLLPGVVFAGVGWQILQTVGINLVSHQFKHTSQVYGVFGLVLALLSFLYLAAQLTVYAAEINVVRARHLWPRSIVQPPLTDPDKEALRGIAEREERRPEEQVTVGFDPSPSPAS
jgi:YihY family inner membrane protein